MQKPKDLDHGTPKPRKKQIPKGVVKILDLPSQRFKYRTLEIYQNSIPEITRMPFDVYLDTFAFKKFVDYLAKDSLLPTTNFRYCIHFPGDPNGSETLCGDSYGENQKFVILEWGKEFYKYVYQVYGIKENFYLRCEDQANLVFFHEAGHLMHCSEISSKSRSQKEIEACAFERKFRKKFKNIFYLKEFKDAPWLKTMQYIENLRK